MEQLREIIKENNIKNIENKFIVYNEEKDVYYSKEKITYTDGSIKYNLRIIDNYKRPIWVTKTFYRNYKQGKEFEDLKRVNMYLTPQKQMFQECLKRLGRIITNKDKDNKYVLKKAVDGNPYIYGINTHGKIFLKVAYQNLYGEVSTKYTIAPLDIEWDTIKDQLCIISFVFNKVCYTFINTEYLKPEDEDNLQKLYTENIPTTDFESKYFFYNTELECVLECFKLLHTLKPDFIAVWNIEYDIGQILKILERNEIDPKDVFSHPDVPNELKYFYYKKDKDFRMSVSGVRKSSEPKDRWHIIEASCYSYFLDAMSVYNYIRSNRKRVPTGYSLDSILGFELGDKFKKLKFKHLTEDLVGLEWHRFMVKNHFAEYVVYNQYDVISMVLLDNKTEDMQNVLALLSECNSFDLFPRGPARLVNEMLLFGLKHNKVLGKSPPLTERRETLGMDGWIITLPNANLNNKYGYKLLNDVDLKSNIRLNVFDLDQISGYPNDIRTANVGRDTTLREVVSIEGKSKNEFMKENINLMFGEINSISYCTNMLNFPSIQELDEFIEKKLK